MIHELSIIIPTLNEEHYLPKLLTSLTQQSFSGTLDIIIVDGNSQDGTRKVAESFAQKLPGFKILVTQKGVSHQRNQGAEHACFPYLLFLDADMVLPAQFLEQFLLRVPQTEYLLASTLFWPASTHLSDYVFRALAYPFIFLAYLWHPMTPGGLTLTTKNLFFQVRGFQEGVTFGEDIDFGMRATNLGAKVYNFLYPFAFHSPRRLRQMGVLKSVVFYLTSYLQVVRCGLTHRKSTFSYPVGNFSQTIE